MLVKMNMTDEAFNAEWGGWRYPFWISIFLVGVSIYIRLKMKESPMFSKLKTEGLEGTFTTFGDQFCDHGDTVNLINNELPDQNGSYLVSKVVTNFGLNGFRNIIELDGKS